MLRLSVKIKMETNILEWSVQQQYSIFVKKSIISKLGVIKKKPTKGHKSKQVLYKKIIYWYLKVFS